MANKESFSYDISDERRDEYRRVSMKSRLAKQAAMLGKGPPPKHAINSPRLDPATLMPTLPSSGLRCLSLFSGGGGLDLGFERAGFEHLGSFDIISICGETLRHNRPHWNVHAGEVDGDIRRHDFKSYRGRVDVLHGGPPCQPFSVAGQQKGRTDERNMWGAFIDVVHAIRPRAFVAENVKGILDSKFKYFVKQEILNPLSDYKIISFCLNAAGFGVPQQRQRVFFVGFLDEKNAERFSAPGYTHDFAHLTRAGGRLGSSKQFQLIDDQLPKCMGVREALGLPKTSHDILAPTIRSAFTGKRNTTSIINSSASVKTWASIEVWGNGVAMSRERAHSFPTENGHFRLSIQDCSILQGFPESWKFCGAVYQALGQIGNSVAPPVAYHVAKKVRDALGS